MSEEVKTIQSLWGTVIADHGPDDMADIIAFLRRYGSYPVIGEGSVIGPEQLEAAADVIGRKLHEWTGGTRIPISGTCRIIALAAFEAADVTCANEVFDGSYGAADKRVVTGKKALSIELAPKYDGERVIVHITRAKKA